MTIIRLDVLFTTISSKDFKAFSMASDGSVASFKLFFCLIISTISKGLVGISELFVSDFVVDSISISSKYKSSAFKKSLSKGN